jgi:hypothetical protein
MQTGNMKSKSYNDGSVGMVEQELPSDISALDAISERAAKLNAYATMLDERLYSVAGRLFGDNVASEGKTSVQSVPSGMIDHIQSQLDTLYSKMSDIEMSANRLERL